MIGLVIVTHGKLADEFIHVMEHVLGPQEAIAAVCIGPHDDMDERRQDILAAVKKVEQGDGVVLLTDLFGGTPSNLAISVMSETSAEVIAGVNLPLLIKLAEVRKTENLREAVAMAREAGQKYINVASALLSMQ